MTGLGEARFATPSTQVASKRSSPTTRPSFAAAARMLDLLGVGAVRLLTNNPAKVAALEAVGVTVTERVAHQLPANPHNARYLDTKRDRTGHLLTK